MATNAKAVTEERPAASRLRRAGLWLLFSTILVIPKALGLRRRPRAWNVVRLVAAVLGLAWVVIGVAIHARTGVAALGAVLAFCAFAITPEHRKLSIDERSRELGALIVVDGGSYRAEDGATAEARLFLGSDRIWALDAALRTLIEIPLAQITLLRVEPAGDAWKLCFAWNSSTAEFRYRGPFAEHLARVAESTLRGQLRPKLPVIQ